MTHWTDAVTNGGSIDRFMDARQYATVSDWWQECNNSDFMLWFLAEIRYRDKRTLRLLSVRFVREIRLEDGRTVWDLLPDERSRQAVIIAERFANGEATQEELKSASAMAEAVEAKNTGRDIGWGRRDAVQIAARGAAQAAAWMVAWSAWNVPWAAAWMVARITAAATWTATRERDVAWETGTETRDAEWEAMEVLSAQQADIIREMIPVAVAQVLFDRYIAQKEIEI